MLTAVKPSSLDFQDPNKKARIENAIKRAVEGSFVKYPMRHMTQHEVARRFNIAFEGYRELRNGANWSYFRALDHIDRLLDEALDGIELNRNIRRSSWFGRSGV